MTTWPARQDGWRLRCGRRDADGRYTCQGEVGRLFPSRLPDGSEGIVASPGVGMVEDPPGSRRWRPRETNARAERDARDGWTGSLSEHDAFRRAFHNIDGDRAAERMARFYPPLPWTTTCPRCADIADVTEDAYTVPVDA